MPDDKRELTREELEEVKNKMKICNDRVQLIYLLGLVQGRLSAVDPTYKPYPPEFGPASG